MLANVASGPWEERAAPDWATGEQGTISVGSVVDTNAAPGATAGGSAPEGTRPAPVALEVPVTATGARPTSTNGQKDLFSEETETVLVAKDGAVIRLSAAVVTGQLLFLTNKTSQREVVCQVLKKRSFRPTSCYVELQFTEAVEDFWGVKFRDARGESSGAAEKAPAEEYTAAVEAAEMVASAEEAEGELGARRGAPSDEEVNQLRGEVEALRKQVKSLLKSGAGVLETAKGMTAASPGKDDGGAPGLVGMKIPVARSGGPENRAGLPETPRAQQEPATRANEMDDGYEALLPQAHPDFQKAPQGAGNASEPTGIYKQTRSRAGARIGAVAAVLVVLGLGSAWSLHLPPFRKRAHASGEIETANPANWPSTWSPPMADGTKNAVRAGRNGTEPAFTATSPTSRPVAAPRVTIPAPVYLPSTPANAVAEDAPAGIGPIRRGAKRTENPSGKMETEDKAATAVLPVAAETGTEEASVVAPKLIKAVNPVYPADAMRNYITGDVQVDALVGANGRVKSMEVKFGPKALRPAAMEAVKQYMYEPAKQNGKPVAAHVSATVKFWFTP